MLSLIRSSVLWFLCLFLVLILTSTARPVSAQSVSLTSKNSHHESGSPSLEGVLPNRKAQLSANLNEHSPASQDLQPKSTRFLGWKLAVRLGQDTRKWHHRKQADSRSIENSYSRSGVIPSLVAGNSTTVVGFDFRRTLPTGFIPTSVVDGDFNEDGKMDVAISNGGDNTVYVLLGNGDGTFRVPEILYTQGQSPVWITTVKLRKNGHLDLVVADADTSTIEIFPGNGDGTFQQSTQVPISQIPTFVVPSDVNNDGKQDIVVGLATFAQGPEFEVLLGNGNGGFSGTMFPPSVSNAYPTVWVAAGDLNRDGFVDIVTTSSLGFGTIYLNQAGSGFLAGDTFAPMDMALVVGLGDMDEDGCPDAVELGDLGYLTIAKGTCDGKFVQADPVAEVGDLDSAIKLVDIDGDGHLDVVASASGGDGGGVGEGSSAGYLVSVLKGDGTGNLAPPQIYRGGMSAYSLVVADFTGDGRPEIITADSAENHATLFLNDSSNHFGDPQGEAIGYLTYPANAPSPLAPMKSADLNGDGKPDLFLVETGPNAPTQPSQLTVLLNDGTGKFLPPFRTPIAVGNAVPTVPSFLAGAFRNSKDPDVVYVCTFASPMVVAFFPSNGDGTFDSPVTLASLPYPILIVSGDFNGDGKLDFAVYGTDAHGAQELDVFLGHGDGTFTQLSPQNWPAISTNSATPVQIFAGDFNHDGKLDLLIGYNANGGWTPAGDDLIEILGHGDGTFATPTVLLSHFGAVAVSDVNHDGYLDLIQKRDPSDDSNNFFYTPAVTVYLGLPNGSFQPQPALILPGFGVPSIDPVLVGDFNGDGIPDVAVEYLPDVFGGASPYRLRVLQGIGDGTFLVTAHYYQLQGVSNPFVGGDFNGDGKDDLMELVGFTSSMHTIPAITGPALDITLDSDPIVASTGSATVTLNLPAVSTTTVTLSASDPAVQIPASLQFATGQQSQSFAFTLGAGFDDSHAVGLYAHLGSETAVAYGSKPNPNSPTGVVPVLLQGPFPLTSEIAITPGESFALSLELQSIDGYTGTFSSFACNGLPAGSSCSFDASSVTVLPGENALVGFTVTTSSSTPFGTYPVAVTSTDGFIQPSVSFSLGIGDFSLSIVPAMSVIGPTGLVIPQVSSTSTNGLDETITLSCSGLPASVTCTQGDILDANGGSTGLFLNGTQVTAGDYPFQVTGQAAIASHTINATLRVGDFTASLDKTAATLSSGQSATFTVTLTSVNHYATDISVNCESPSSKVTCSASPVPATLADGGTATVTITVTAAASASSTRPPLLGPNRKWYALLWLGPLALIAGASRGRIHVAALYTVLVLMAMSGCGGGSNSSGGGGGGGGGTTINLTVTATAAYTQIDSNNHKSLGPVKITLQ